MAVLEIALLIIGVVLLIGSFFITEKLSNTEVQKMAELSDDEIKKILEKRLQAADERIDGKIEDAIDNSIGKVERSLDKETNEKIMAIHEYSDTVMDEMNKTREEITFLYSMLNDRHREMTEMAGSLKELIHQAGDAKRSVQQEEAIQPVPIQPVPIQPEKPAPTMYLPEREIPAPELFAEEPLSVAESPGESELLPEDEAEDETFGGEGNHNGRILELAAQGMDAVDIAKELSLGTGEVQLVLDLFRRS
ncbi:MAG: hypothetical protein IJJ13_00250 [Lachnospiraceae bacterium]|nr:hypothetical protein [Lachnospiraceae bacterium]